MFCFLHNVNKRRSLSVSKMCTVQLAITSVDMWAFLLHITEYCCTSRRQGGLLYPGYGPGGWLQYVFGS